MCLAIPGQIVSIDPEGSEETLWRMGRVRFGGIVKEVSLAYVPEAQVGDYVVVHVGFAISRLNEEEAVRVFEYVQAMEDMSEMEEAVS